MPLSFQYTRFLKVILSSTFADSLSFQEQYLEKDSLNVAVVHCLAGRGRTGSLNLKLNLVLSIEFDLFKSISLMFRDDNSSLRDVLWSLSRYLVCSSSFRSGS